MNRSNWLLLGIACVLAALLSIEPPGRQHAQPKPSPQAELEPIQQIQLFLGNDEQANIVIQRSDSHWRLSRPVAIAADEFAIGEILRLRGAERSPALSGEVDLAALKLDPPLWRVRFDEREMAIGGIESLQQKRYVLENDDIFLIPDFNPGPLDGNYADLVSRQLIPSEQSIQNIQFPDEVATQPGPELRELWENAEAQWTSRPLASDFAAVDARIIVNTDQQSLDFLICERSPRLKLIRPDIDVLYNLPASAAAELLSPDA